MPDSGAILVTGATGNLGPHALTHLLATGRRVRALVLPDDPRADRVPAGVEVVHGDLARPETVEPALVDVDGVLLMWPFFTLRVDTVPAVLDLISERARRIAFVSSIGVHIGLEARDNNCHSYLESMIEKTDLEWTFLQTTGFASNARGLAEQIRGDGVVRFPYGAAARSSVHEGDVAEVAARALTTPGHAGARYVTTGPETLTQAQQVAIIGEVIGRELRWEDVPASVAREQMIAQGWPPSYADGALDYFAQLVQESELVTTAVHDVLGRPPRTFREWAVENADAFR